jgi:DNA-binding GntR family transcriptional regulator
MSDSAASPLKLTAQSLEERVYDELRDAIVAGEFRPGDTLVEAQLSRRFGISKTPVREALIRLKRDGLVDSPLHRVNRVATPTPADIHEACEVRTWIEAEIAARCAQAPTPELLRQLEASIDETTRALTSGDVEVYGRAIRRFSDVLAAAASNRYAVEALDRLRNVLILIAHISRETPGRRQRSIDAHRVIYEAIKRRDREAAAEATRRHLASIEADSLRALSDLTAEAG